MSMTKKKEDRGERFFKRWTWMDWMLIGLLVVLLIGGGLLVRFLTTRNEGREGVVTYTVLLSDVEEARFLDDDGELPFAVGSVVKSQNGTAKLGEITEISRRVHRTATVKGGKLVWIDSEGRYDYGITVRSDASHAVGDGIRVGDIRIAAGMRMTLRLGRFLGASAQVISVDWEDAQDD